MASYGAVNDVAHASSASRSVRSLGTTGERSSRGFGSDCTRRYRRDRRFIAPGEALERRMTGAETSCSDPAGSTPARQRCSPRAGSESCMGSHRFAHRELQIERRRALRPVEEHAGEDRRRPRAIAHPRTAAGPSNSRQSEVKVGHSHRLRYSWGYFRCSMYLRVHLRTLTGVRLADTAISAPLLRGSVRKAGYQVVASSPRGIFFSTS